MNMLNINYNPDVLNCLANLSNDEVFTPPELVNDMLDMLPNSLWSNPDITFLDPFTKSGVFLREIATRLMSGLEEKISDKQERINHIFEKQIFGIAITELTSLLARRSVYCSKIADGKYSVCETFTTGQGNIKFDKTLHSWDKEKCIYCGASQSVYEREDALETHAYQFIHTQKPEEIFNMRFDVIVGNPPYQFEDGGFGKSAKPIYHKFVEQSKKLQPRYLAMIIPARWYAGGKGLDSFREEMLNDNRIKEIHDFPETSDCFPGLNIRGGICYFLWSKEYGGDCKITTHKSATIGKAVIRPLLEENTEIFIRYNEAISILRKVRIFKKASFSDIVSSRKPFGLATNFLDFKKIKSEKNNIKLYRFGDNGYIGKEQIKNNLEFLDQYKIIIPKASPGSDSYPHAILGKPIISEPITCCTETYIVIGPFSSKEVAKNVSTYIATRFFRFLVLLIKNTQDVPKKVYSFVPIQDFTQPWTDEKLYKKYNLNKEEIAFIESMIRPMELDHE